MVKTKLIKKHLVFYQIRDCFIVDSMVVEVLNQQELL
jgi:hypothetical protein